MYRHLLGPLILLAAPTTAEAQASDAPAPSRGTARYHDETPADVVVTAPVSRELGAVTGGVSVLSGAELVREMRPTVGETLSRQAGVSATSFGPNASRPVLRGLQGDRVRILTDGIGSFDASTTSVDHAVAINPLTADRIEVLRGPAALLFGSSAIGGVVNIIDSRIPRQVPDEPVHIDALASYGSAARERSVAGSSAVRVGDKIVLHVDGSYAKTADLRVGGFVLAPAQRAAAAASPDPTVAALAELKDRVPNTAARTWELAGGAAIVTDGGNLGFSVSRYDNLYGVPERYAVSPGDPEPEQVRLHIRQTRADLRAEVTTGGSILDRIRFRAGWADYRHDELEETGAVGTTFLNQSHEARLELVQHRQGAWSGVIGAQMLARRLEVVGEEKFVPRNDTDQYGVFTIQELRTGPLLAELGGRFERSIVTAAGDDTLGNAAIRRSFDTLSASAGASLEVAPGIRIGISGSHTERAPSAEELFARGNHAGTQAFELGDVGLAKERSNGVEATLKGSGRGYSFAGSVYYSRFANFIYQSQVDDSICEAARPGAVDFPCFATYQGRARYYGVEAEGRVTVARAGGFDLSVDALGDMVRARVDDVGPAPRIPPLRLLGGVEANSDRLDGRVEVEWSDAQRRITGYETPTPAFTLVNASLSLRPFADNRATTLVLSANNILDVVARRHASFLKDYAPLAGRDIRLSARISF